MCVLGFVFFYLSKSDDEVLGQSVWYTTVHDALQRADPITSSRTVFNFASKGLQGKKQALCIKKIQAICICLSLHFSITMEK